MTCTSAACPSFRTGRQRRQRCVGGYLAYACAALGLGVLDALAVASVDPPIDIGTLYFVQLIVGVSLPFIVARNCGDGVHWVAGVAFTFLAVGSLAAMPFLLHFYGG